MAPVPVDQPVVGDVAEVATDVGVRPDEVRVHKTEKPTQHEGWSGIAVGAVAGILFRPSIIGGAIVGGTAGAVIGHLWRGMSRGDLKDLGEGLDEGAAAVIVIGESRIDEQIEKATKRARKLLQKQIDANANELKRQIDVEAEELKQQV
jgi:uncharacterized membrane protein